MVGEIRDEIKKRVGAENMGSIKKSNYQRLRESLDGVKLTDREDSFLLWLSEWSSKETDDFIRIINKVKGAVEHGKSKEE